MNSPFKRYIRLLITGLTQHPAHKARQHCFHCHEEMSAEEAILVSFAGSQYQVCCHGCQAVLQTIEANKMVDAYLQLKQDAVSKPA